MERKNFVATAAVPLVLIASQLGASAQSFRVDKTSTTSGSVNLDVYKLWAVMTGPTDTILNAFQMKGLTGAVGNAFYHKDLASYNSGVLMKSDGNWSPSSVGSATLNRPFDCT
jgi:hypothetical protein